MDDTRLTTHDDGRQAIAIGHLSDSGDLKRLSWCQEKRRWSVENNWKRIIFSDESKIMIGHDEWVYMWRKAGEGWWPDLVYERPQPKFEVMMWECISWFGPGTVTAVHGNINAIKYQDILEDHLWPVIAQNFSQGGYIFQDHNAPVHRARLTVAYIKLKIISRHSSGLPNHQTSI